MTAHALQEAPPERGIGDNGAPAPTPFEAIKTHIDDLYDEAVGFLDGEPIDSQGQAEAVGNLLNMIREAEKVADQARVQENGPFDAGKAEVQARYAPLIGNTKTVTGKTVRAADACKAALKPWLTKLEAARVADAQAKAAEAARLAEVAAAAVRETNAADLAGREQAEGMVKDAMRASRDAARADNDTAKVSGGYGRAASLRTTHTPVLMDGVIAARHYWETRRDEFEQFIIGLARTDVAAGKRAIPGFNVIEETKVV